MNDVVDLSINHHRELQRMFEVLRNEPGKRAAMAPMEDPAEL